MKKIKIKDIFCFLLLVAIVIFSFKGYTSTDRTKDVTNKFPQIQEIKKNLNKKYSFLSKDDINIIIEKSLPSVRYSVKIDYMFNKNESIENRIKATLYTIDEIDSLIDINEKIDYFIELKQPFNNNPNKKTEEISIRGNNNYSQNDRKLLNWSVHVIGSTQAEQREIETLNLIKNIIKEWYNK